MMMMMMKLIPRPDSHILLVFEPKRHYPISTGTSSAGATNTRRWGKIAIFD